MRLSFERTRAIQIRSASQSVVCLLLDFNHLILAGDGRFTRPLPHFPHRIIHSFIAPKYEFLNSNFRRTGEKLFKFRVLQHTVVALSGEEARKVFFNDKRLNFNEGYRLFLGGAPQLSDINMLDADDAAIKFFYKYFQLVLTKERIMNVLPFLLDGMHKRMQIWGSKGRINPFKEIYDLVFWMTIRMASCSELADDTEASARFEENFWTLEQSSTPVALLLPWFPSRAKRNRERATRELYSMLQGYIDKRRNADVPSADTIDLLLQDGAEDAEIIQFILSVIFAGVTNTGMIVCWILLYFDQNPEWKAKVSAEVHNLLCTRTDSTGVALLHERLAALPMAAIEEETPALELVIRETIRLILANGTVLRRNVAKELRIGDQIVPRDAFMAYNLADVHLDPELYPDPTNFDPARFEAGREEDKKTTFGYLGWGAGRHPCVGMKIAKLEIKMVVALFLVGYDYKLVDANGHFPDPFPVRDPNDLLKARPMGKPCFIDFERIVD
ncbi:hypothetical protein SCP_0200070 [Sparassis crispa]|uniref:Cytochrome P450 n=1 Tax=Sparassis crispa TaxID=139825 RepID=A0A401G9G1_9APHY|nr:hypothetical protein SCP_0200070 [Sparassis crispa]GBE78810.1 hypothetical protein SCP_0200070 [Sparassis crispa]